MPHNNTHSTIEDAFKSNKEQEYPTRVDSIQCTSQFYQIIITLEIHYNNRNETFLTMPTLT